MLRSQKHLAKVTMDTAARLDALDFKRLTRGTGRLSLHRCPFTHSRTASQADLTQSARPCARVQSDAPECWGHQKVAHTTSGPVTGRQSNSSGLRPYFVNNVLRENVKCLFRCRDGVLFIAPQNGTYGRNRFVAALG